MSRFWRVLGALWPDFYVAVVIGAGALISLTDAGAGASVSIGKVLGSGAGFAYLALVAFVSVLLALSVARRKAIRASQAAGALAVLLVLNGGALYVNDPSAASRLALSVYLCLGVLMTNRCIVLTYAVVVPSWLRDEVARHAVRVAP